MRERPALHRALGRGAGVDTKEAVQPLTSHVDDGAWMPSWKSDVPMSPLCAWPSRAEGVLG